MLRVGGKKAEKGKAESRNGQAGIANGRPQVAKAGANAGGVLRGRRSYPDGAISPHPSQWLPKPATIWTPQREMNALRFVVPEERKFFCTVNLGWRSAGRRLPQPGGGIMGV
jgi:hypothetical protein